MRKLSGSVDVPEKLNVVDSAASLDTWLLTFSALTLGSIGPFWLSRNRSVAPQAGGGLGVGEGDGGFPVGLGDTPPDAPGLDDGLGCGPDDAEGPGLPFGLGEGLGLADALGDGLAEGLALADTLTAIVGPGIDGSIVGLIEGPVVG